MAVGDTKADLQSIAAGAVLTVQPSAGEEWIIHNVGAEGAHEVRVVVGTNELVIPGMSASSGEGYIALYIHLTNAHYIKIKNTEGAAAKLLWYNGVQSK